jgi:Holliday junction resolvase RusA-like endonuclease
MAGEPLVSILLPGDPRGKGRPRFRIVKPRGRPQFVTVYTDRETGLYEEALARCGRVAMGALAPLDGPLTCFAEAFMPIPESWSNKKKAAAAAGDVFHVSKPDGDNIAKCVGDALNKICWVDDSQIVMWQVLKVYSDFPRLRVSVWAWDDVGPAEPELIGV